MQHNRKYETVWSMLPEFSDGKRNESGFLSDIMIEKVTPLKEYSKEKKDFTGVGQFLYK